MTAPTDGFAVAPATDAECALLISRASRVLAAGGLRDLVWGHVSVRDHAGRGLWMKRSGLGFEEIEPDDVQLIDWSGEVVVGQGDRHIEWHIHAGVYHARTEVTSIVHAHSDAVNAWCATGEPMRALSHAGIDFTLEQLPRFTETASLIRNAELRERLAQTLGGAVGVVIPRHGFVTVGEDVAVAVMRAVQLERAAGVLLTALAAGNVDEGMSEEDIRALGWPLRQVHAGFDYLVRESERMLR
ncbi:class II aldolase/adducin family protein [Microbacterium sp. A196]|uniref:class II aldolase/adducin family protein n=1 Tax=Microbacterium sp. A196 TaxID=3457320 RepID=UPI003FD3E1C7